MSSGQVRHVGADANGRSHTGEHQLGAKPHSFLLIPASDAGKQFGQLAKEHLPELHLVSVPGQADLMFCQEKGVVNGDDLERILRTCRTSYDEVAYVPTTSPHSRFDIQEWTPLDL